MTAQKKIEDLTDAWYGYAIFAGIGSFLYHGIGFFSLLWVAMTTSFSLFVAFFIGRRLRARSSLTRMIVIVLSAIGLVTGTLGVLKFGSAFLSNWSIGGLAMIAVVAAGLYMHVRSLRVLTDASVKSYFR